LTRVRKVVLGLALPGRIGGDEAGIVDEGEKGRLQQLDHDQRTGNSHERDPRKAHTSCITPEMESKCAAPYRKCGKMSVSCSNYEVELQNMESIQNRR
jgi:hypothetical protein